MLSLPTQMEEELDLIKHLLSGFPNPVWQHRLPQEWGREQGQEHHSEGHVKK